MRFLFVAFLVASFVPIDITLRNFFGPPRFVPLILGAPRENDVEFEEVAKRFWPAAFREGMIRGGYWFGK